MTRLFGDLQLAEDSVQEACSVALGQWSVEGTPANPTAWLVGPARHKAIDRIRRESRRADKEAAAMQFLEPTDMTSTDVSDDDSLSLIFMCCHPALDPTVRVPLTSPDCWPCCC